MKNKKWQIDPISLFSHELKTPLSSLKLGLSLLEKDFNKHKHLLYLMIEEVDKAIDFITDNLDLRFIQQKKDLFQFAWKQWPPLLKTSCLALQQIAKKQNVTFNIKALKQQNFEILMDSSWMICVLKNILSNAVLFSPKNSTVVIEYSFDNKKGFVCLVKDSGPGISDAKQIFNSFYTLTPSSGTTTKQRQKSVKNTGLGLSIAKAIVERHGGSISAFSIPNKKGAVFRFVLPQVRPIKQVA